MSSFKLGQRGIRLYYPPKSLWARHYFQKVLENIFILSIQWQHWFPISQIPSLFLTDSITKANCQSIGVCSIISWERLLYHPVNSVLCGYSYFWLSHCSCMSLWNSGLSIKSFQRMVLTSLFSVLCTTMQTCIGWQGKSSQKEVHLFSREKYLVLIYQAQNLFTNLIN